MPGHPYAEVEIAWIVLFSIGAADVWCQIQTSQGRFANHIYPILYISIMDIHVG